MARSLVRGSPAWLSLLLLTACAEPPPAREPEPTAPPPSATAAASSATVDVTPPPASAAPSVALPEPASTLAPEPIASAPPAPPSPVNASPTDTPSDVAVPPTDAKHTPTGIAFKVLRKGNGRQHPRATDDVLAHYAGWTADGRLFDATYNRGQPISLPLSGVIAGWQEGLQLMVVGEKTRFWIPAQLAYGNSSSLGTPKGQLTFDIELLEIKRKPRR